MKGDVGRLTAAEHAEIDQYTLLLAQLRDDPTFVALRDTQLAGTTARRWDVASAAVMSAASRLDKWRETVAQADRLVAANPSDRERADQLLNGRTVLLTPAETPKEDRRPPASPSSEPRFSLVFIKGLIADDLRTARRVVVNVAEVLAVVRPRLDQLTARLDDAESLLDPLADDDNRAALAALRRGVGDLRQLSQADPLALRPSAGAGPPGLAGLTRLDAVDADLARLASRLAPTAQRRAGTTGRLARLRVAVTELAALESHARDRRASLVGRIAVRDMPAALSAAGDLAARLDAAETRLRRDWDAGNGELAEMESAIKAATDTASQVIRRADEIVAEWQLLRFRLENYRIRADRRGIAMRPNLVTLHQEARQLLQAEPCDLGRTEDAIRRYMEQGNDPGQE